MHSMLRRTAIGFSGFLAFATLAYWFVWPAAEPRALAGVRGNPAAGASADLEPLAHALPAPAEAPPDPPDAEFRAIWVVATDLTTPAKVREVVRRAREHHFNALILQVRMRGDALYRSDLVPRSELLDGQDESFDPLQLALDEARAAGIEVHAWLNAFHTWSRPSPPRSPKHIRNSRPEWFLRGSDGKIHGLETQSSPQAYYEPGLYVNPANLAVREHLVAVYRELVERYDVAGIHFDFIRFPSRVGPAVAGADYSPATLQRYRAELGREPVEHTPEWDQWRADQVTALVRDVYRETKRLKPRVKVSAAVMAHADLARGRSFTDYRGWLKEGILDFAVPMDYTRDLDDAAHNAEVALRAGGPGRVYIGLGAYMNKPPELLRQIEAVRAAGAKGIVLFAYSSLDDPYYAALRGGPFPAPVSRPRLPVYRTSWQPGPIPRPLEPEWLGRLPAAGDEPGFTRLFYVHSANTALVIDNHGLEVTELTVNGKPVPLPPAAIDKNGRSRIDIGAYVDPSTHRPTWVDNHTSRMTVKARGPGGAWADFFIETNYAR